MAALKPLLPQPLLFPASQYSSVSCVIFVVNLSRLHDSLPHEAWTSMEYYPPDWRDEAAGKFRCDLFVAIL